MNKLFLTLTLALFTTMASAQFSVLTTVTEVEEEYKNEVTSLTNDTSND